MNKKESLENKTVTLYMDGGWEFSGKIKIVDEKKFIVENSGNLIMVFRDKISCLILSEEERLVDSSEDPSGQLRALGVSSSEVREPEESRFPMNRLSYEETMMSIPGTLLGESAKDLDDELSVYYPGGARISEDEGGTTSNLSFEVEDDTEE